MDFTPLCSEIIFGNKHLFSNNLKTENGADIDGYIKKTHGSKSKLTTDFLFSKSKDEKKPNESSGSETVVNKDSEVIA